MLFCVSFRVSVAGVYQYAVNLELLNDPDTEDISNLLAQVRIYSCIHWSDCAISYHSYLIQVSLSVTGEMLDTEVNVTVYSAKQLNTTDDERYYIITILSIHEIMPSSIAL